MNIKDRIIELAQRFEGKPRSRKVIVTILAHWADERGCFSDTLVDLSDLCRTSVPRFKRHLRDLINAGILHRTPQFKGKQTANLYRWDVEKLAKAVDQFESTLS